MQRTLLIAVVLIVMIGPAAAAHHSHPDFLLDFDKTVEGTLQEIVLKNPHTILTLLTSDGTLYTIEWQSALILQTRTNHVLPVEAPVTRDTLHIGDRLIVTGAPHKDLARHELVVIKNVQRPLDGWRWTCDIPERRIGCGRGG